MNLPTPKQARILWFSLTALAIAVFIGLIAATVWGLGRIIDLLSPVLWPLALAAVAACVLSPLVDLLERRRVSRLWAIIMVFAAAILIVGGVLASVIPQVVVETRDLVRKVPDYSRRLQHKFDSLMEHPPALIGRFLPPPAVQSETTSTNSDLQATGDSTNAPPTATNASPSTSAAATTSANAAVPDWLTDSLPQVGNWLLKQFGKVLSGFGMLAGLILIPVYAFYFLLEKKTIEERWKDYLPLHDSRGKQEVVFVIESINQYLVAFFRGQVIVAICDAVLYTVGFLALGLNYAFLIGFAAVGLTMIPFIGAIIICAAALALSFAQYSDWLHPVLILAIFAVVQTLEGLVISPKIIGDRVGLPPVIIIIAVMVGTTLLGGLLGGILAIPLAAALRVILLRYVWNQKSE
jgi:predicted PurR-regulated permease PerM